MCNDTMFYFPGGCSGGIICGGSAGGFITGKGTGMISGAVSDFQALFQCRVFRVVPKEFLLCSVHLPDSFVLFYQF